MKPIKFSAFPEDTKAYVYPGVWQLEPTTGPDRIVIAPSNQHIDLIRKLIQPLPEPFGVLYVLAVPRGDAANPGRYQSAKPCDRAELEAFLDRFQEYFEQDGRHHLWLFSLPSQAQIVYDNHDLIYGYGPLDTFAAVAGAEGLTKGEARIPSPHTHHYNAQYDEEERAILNYWDWRYFPLAEED